MKAGQGLWRRMTRVLVFISCLLPLSGLVMAAIYNRLGPDPAKTLVDETGLWTFRILLLCLAMSPLRLLSGNNVWISYRRMLGLFAMFYGSLHLLAYGVLLLGADLGALSRELVKRPYIIAGFSAWLLMLPLAVTSTRQWQRRLGKRWLLLHKLVYIVALLGMMHFIWLKKIGIWAVWPYAIILILLFMMRLPSIKRLAMGIRSKIKAESAGSE